MTGQMSRRQRGKGGRVAVVAAGVISPLGAGLEATLASLRAARDCISPVERFPVEQCRCTTAGQVDDLIRELRLRVERAERVLVTTLTKKMAEDLAD